jgi:hypothetical protein
MNPNDDERDSFLLQLLISDVVFPTAAEVRRQMGRRCSQDLIH